MFLDRVLHRRGKLYLVFILSAIGFGSAAGATDVYVPQAVRGDSANTTRILIWNTSGSATSVTVEFFNQSGVSQEAQTRIVGVDATEEVILGGPDVTLTVGWVKVSSSGTVLVTAFLSLAGVPQVGVLPVTGADQWGGVGEVNAEANTGVAAANPGSTTANCMLTAYRANGTVAGTANLTLQPGEQTAQFLDELIPDLATPYQGCFSLTCEGGNVVPVALRQRRSDAAFTTVAMPSSLGSTESYFAQAVRGDPQNTTRILIWNSGTVTASVTVEFSDQSGVIRETQNRTVGAKATQEVVLGEEGLSLTVGSVKVTSNADVLVTAFFNILGVPEVGVLPVTGAGWWAGVGDVSTLVNTGLAVANAGLGSANCELTAYNANGSLAGSTGISLEPGEQTARFLGELMPTLPSSYQGCFSLHCEGGNVVSVVLRQRRSDGALATVAMPPIPDDGNGGVGSGQLLVRTIEGLSSNQGADVVLTSAVVIRGKTGIGVSLIRAGCNGVDYFGVFSAATGDYAVAVPADSTCNLTVIYLHPLSSVLRLRYDHPPILVGTEDITEDLDLPEEQIVTLSGTVDLSTLPSELKAMTKRLGIHSTNDTAFGFPTLVEDSAILPAGADVLPYSTRVLANTTYVMSINFFQIGPFDIPAFYAIDNVSVGGSDITANLTVPAAVKVSGIVTQAQTTPKAGTVVFFDQRAEVEPGGPLRLLTGLTASLSFIQPNGSYDLYVTRGQTHNLFSSLTLNDGSVWATPVRGSDIRSFDTDTTLNFTFPNKPAETSFSGRVTRAGGSGVPDVFVSLSCADITGAPNTTLFKSTTTDAQGDYALEVFGANDCTVFFSPPAPSLLTAP